MTMINPVQEKELTMAKSALLLDKEDAHLKDLPETSDLVVGQGFYRLAKLYYDKADLRKAEEFFIKAIEETSYPRDCFGIFKMYGFLIRIHSEAMNDEKAKKYIDLSTELVEKMSRDLGSLNAEFFYNLGVVKNYSGDFTAAHENFLMASTKAEQEGDMSVLPKSLFALAQGYFSQGKLEESKKYLDKLERQIEEKHKDYLKGTLYILNANIASEEGDLDKCIALLDKALAALKKKACWNLMGQVLLLKGIAFRKMGEFAKSVVFFDLAKNVIDESYFRRLNSRIESEIQETSGSSVDIYLDRHNKLIFERDLGQIDFKHRFVLLEILFLLARHTDSCFDKEELAKRIWKDEYNPLIHDKLIYTSVSRLRKLIEPKSGKRKYILRRKDGYTFNPRIVARFIGENEVKAGARIGNVEISSPV